MDTPFSAVGAGARPLPRLFYGWVVVGLAAAAMVGTLPGRTQGLGLITEPLLADLGLGRLAYGALNFWATLLVSLGALGVGRALDRLGSRAVLCTVALALGLVVCAMSRVHSAWGLAVALTLTRALGQSALSVVSIAMVGQWFQRGIERAMAVYSVALSLGFMLAFPLVGALVQDWGWRGAWLAVGATLVLGLAPLAWVLARRSPEACGLALDGEGTRGARLVSPAPVPELAGHTWGAALRTQAFWVFALGTALYGFVASGIGLFNEAILAERGFGAELYYRTLVITAFTGLAGNFLGGALARRVALGRLLALALFVLAAGLAALPYLSTAAQIYAWATAMGLGGGLVMVLFFGVWPRVYGRRELGRIQGSAQAITVLFSALGPVACAWTHARTGSYAPIFEALALLIAALGAAAVLVKLPEPAVARERPFDPGERG